MNIKSTDKLLQFSNINLLLISKLLLVNFISYVCFCLLLQLNIKTYFVSLLATCLVFSYCLLTLPKQISPWRAYFSALIWLLFPTVAIIYLDRLSLTKFFPSLAICVLSLYLIANLGTLTVLILERELCFYLFFGALTTVVSVGTFSLATSIFLHYGINSWLWAQTISFALSLLFAFITNRKYVFCSRGPFLRELERFIGARLLSSLLCEYLLMALLADAVKMNLDLAKIITAFMVVIINYILSKVFVFQKSRVQ